MKCPNCGFASLPEMRFCGQCGTRLAHVCPACGFANPPDHRFCGQCGMSLAEQSVSAQLRQPQPSVQSGAAPVPLQGERRLATVILAKVKGSTDLAEQIGTEVWVDKALIASAYWHIGLISLGQREWRRAVDAFQSALQL